MLRRSEAMIQAVQDLLASGLASQARRGDSLGVWTFNEELHIGLVPLQEWSPQAQAAITQRVTGFLRAQKLEKAGRLEKVVPALNRLVNSSPFLTVILVCTGDAELRGTRYDERINQFFQTWRTQQQDARAPFIVALRAQAGALVDCSVNPAPWRAELPALPRELFVPLVTAKPPVAEPRKQTTSSVPPLIIIGKKREAPQANTNAQTTTAAALPASATQTNLVAQALADSQAVSPAVSASKPLDLSSAQPLTASATAASAPLVAPTVVPTSPPALSARRTTDSVSSPVSAVPVGAVRPVYNTNARSVEFASTTPAGDGPRSIVPWVIGAVLLLAILASVWIWRVRSRSSGGESSLITESIDRHKPQR
jgi:hypothetical protein